MTARSHLVFAAALFALGLTACEGCRKAPGASSSSAGSGAALGPPNVRLYLLTDMAGALEPCGCTKDQLGGLDHFGAWVKHELASAPASLVASAGPLFFMDDVLDRERADQDRAKAQTIARVLKGLDFVAFAPGVNDWADGRPGLTALASASGAVAIVESAQPAAPFAPVVVREAGGVKVGFVGFGPSDGASTNDAVAPALIRGVEEAKRQGANVLIALVAVGRGEAKRVADAIPDLTAVVVGSVKSRGDANTTASPPEQVGNVLIVQAANHLQTVSVLDLYVRAPPAPGQLLHFADGTGLELAQRREDLTRRIDELHERLASWERDPNANKADVDARRHELADLEHQREGLAAQPPPPSGSFFRIASKEMRDSLGKDPAIEAQMVDYYKSVDEHNRVAFADRVPPKAGPDQSAYVGVSVCADCHQPAVDFWKTTAHAHAYATLSSQFKEFNLECVGCHVTGYDRPGGTTVTHVDKLEDVQCEVCHGPGAKHVATPLDEGRIIAKPEPAKCLECHHPPHVEGFDAVAKMKSILGPGHGQPRR